MATKGINPFAKGTPTKTAAPKAPAGKAAPGMASAGAKVNPFATKTGGPAFKKGGSTKC